MVEQFAVNEKVLGSSPSRGAHKIFYLANSQLKTRGDLEVPDNHT